MFNFKSFNFSLGDAIFIGLCLEGFFFGLYSAIFAMYLQYHASKTDADKTKRILFYSICILYALSGVIAVLDAGRVLYSLGFARSDGERTLFNLDLISTTIIGCSDFLSQSILIYRCWVVWGCDIHVVIVPSILTFSFLGLWLTGNSTIYLLPHQVVNPQWGSKAILTSLFISLTVNALMTGLIVFRIFKVYRQVKTIHDRNSDATGGSKLRAVMFVLIESGMLMFAVQMVRVVLGTAQLIPSPLGLPPLQGSSIVIGVSEMLYGMTPTIILVRVSMGLSYHDEKSMVEATASICFASDDPHSSRGSIT